MPNPFARRLSASGKSHRMIWITIGLLLLAIAIGVTLSFLVLRGSARRPMRAHPGLARDLRRAGRAHAVFRDAQSTRGLGSKDARARSCSPSRSTPCCMSTNPRSSSGWCWTTGSSCSTAAASTCSPTRRTRRSARPRRATSRSASDAALLALMNDMLRKMQTLRANSADDCYRYLFSEVAGRPTSGSISTAPRRSARWACSRK